MLTQKMRRGERERQRERERETDRQRKRERERERDREHTSTHARRRETWPFDFSFYVFFLPLGLPCVSWAGQECCLFYLRSSLRSSGLPLTFLCSIFAGFSLSCLLATAILDTCFLF